MGEITLKIEEDVLDRLRTEALSRGTTVEEEARRVLVDAILKSRSERPRSHGEILRRMEEIGNMSPPITDVDITQLIREDRDR